MHSLSRRPVTGPHGDRYYAIHEESPDPGVMKRPRRDDAGCRIRFEDEMGNYVGSALLYHRVPLWRVSAQEISAMLAEALAHG